MSRHPIRGNFIDPRTGIVLVLFSRISAQNPNQSPKMTLELVDLDRLPGYAGALHAARHPTLANRFHFWRGLSGRRYACTRFPAGRVPAYATSIALFVRRRGGMVEMLGVSTALGCPVVPLGTEEVHLHIVCGGADVLNATLQDLVALAARYAPQMSPARRAA
jgi:hypothetical protein